ncbi:intestinal mucin-like protein isoform X2 [Mixophyes fleayi]|uniref:intestinal mucin-like protein isoform X2 n=1 Tax=Mixophyes fleayi TaxID=3061075 RepID=UPI003F4DEF0A
MTSDPEVPGETWIDNCQVCICDEDLVKVSCSRMKCPPLNYPLCDKPWLQPYTLQDEENQCCSKIECRCEPSKCQYLAESCPLGHEAIPTISEGECCVTFNCRPMNVCIVNGNVYQIGQTIWEERSLCKECSCSEIKDSKTGFNTVICDPILCRIECPQGYDYEKSNNDCCGKCVQVSCALTAADGSIYLLEPGKSQFLPDDNCTMYTCALIGENLVTSSLTHICPNLHDEECDSDQLVKDPDGCCNICQAPKTCRVRTNVTEITQKGCSANVTLSYCEGSCPSLTMFSDKSLKRERMCGCCLETETTNIEIELFCPGDTSNIKAFITSVKNCACTIANCIP